ncbi:MAG: substrate-binding domain-containing protein [Povalibacter sp.]
MRARWLAALASFTFVYASAEARELRVCADPNNMPFSNEARQGFENRIVEIVARELKAQVTYVWWAQRRGNVRNTLQQGLCDVIPGVATDLEMLSTTQPYYRSAYVFVTRQDRHLEIRSFDDERLPKLTVGVQMIGDDFANTPPADALMRRGMVQNVRGYMVYGDYSKESPPRAIVEAVANSNLDVAVVWGPLAGYFAQRSAVPLQVETVAPLVDATLPMSFNISMGTRREDAQLRGELNAALERRRDEIHRVLHDYGVPLLEVTPKIQTSERRTD